MQIIYGGDAAFNALAYGAEVHPANTAYFQRQIENISSTLTDVGRSFFANTQALYDQANNSDIMRIARAAVRTAKSLFQPNEIRSLFDIASLQNAQPAMQRWVMANPEVREVYHKQRCDGYSETYVDIAPNVIGEQHYDYRRVMDSVIVEADDTWSVKFYPDELYDGDKELNHDEKVDVLNTWRIVEMFIKAGDRDPTSAYDAKL